MTNKRFEYENLFEEFERRKAMEKSNYFDLASIPDFGRYYTKHGDKILKFDGRITDIESCEGRRIIVSLYPFGKGNDSEPQQTAEVKIPLDVLARRNDRLIEHFVFGMPGNEPRTLCEYSVIVDLNCEEGKGINYFIGRTNQKQRAFRERRIERLKKIAG